MMTKIYKDLQFSEGLYDEVVDVIDVVLLAYEDDSTLYTNLKQKFNVMKHDFESYTEEDKKQVIKMACALAYKNGGRF